ncbi:MAG: F0F1 ATP synthase subunit epsilon [Saprospiraceae bacterium]|nr:F0F1 ATP synthase subunit epsilon [Saprospiraceae bacterium]MCB0625499.1 F0F1 ATP synthase subunit epsilon [Saprospiraceae bacterium]MCB0680438.1 F0F1 ATP synthase subunit epsilon [Saprospiraceae bacterium]
MAYDSMQLKILLPFRVFAERTEVKRIVAETQEGSFGLLPNRLDCAAALAPGILTYETEAEGEVFVAVAEGVLIKAGAEVLVSVRNAIGGVGLDELHQAVEREFLQAGEEERNLRTTLAKLEVDFVRRFAALKQE